MKIMFTIPEAPDGGETTVEIGPAPYYHRSDCNIAVSKTV
jgi:hypothetical protein